jgi:metal-responsive CopG/Arc/MetJ family transcriptional regulator
MLYARKDRIYSMASENSESVIVKLDAHLMDALDKICEEWGIRSRADVIERILEEVLAPDSSECQPIEANLTQGLEGGS